MTDADESITALCDESKCVSRGLSGKRFNASFTCYGDETGEFYPMMCADGYRPRVLDSVLQTFDSFPSGYDLILRPDDNKKCSNSEETGDAGCENVSLRYFTCCPPVPSIEELSELLPPQRHCSDPITIAADETEANIENPTSENFSLSPLSCVNGTFPYEMKPYVKFGSTPVRSYVCCDAPVVEHTINFLNDENYTECVPYHDKHYEERKVINSYGRLEEILCRDISNSNDVWVPRPLDIEWNHTYDRDAIPTAYQCCKTGLPMPPFVEDPTFCKTVYPSLFLFSLSAFLNVFLMVALCLPLVTKTASTSQSAKSFRRRRRSSNISTSQRPYSTYNLYLVYLGIPDLLLIIYNLCTWGILANNNAETYSHRFSALSVNKNGVDVSAQTVAIVYSLCNLYLNLIISWEVLTLLRNCHQRKRVGPPLPWEVTKKALAVYGLAFLVLGFALGMLMAASRAENQYDFETAEKLIGILHAIYYSLVLALPIILVTVISIMICTRGYLSKPKNSNQNGVTRQSSARRDSSMRELAWYFVRIIAVFFLVWIPSMGAFTFCISSKDGDGIYNGTGCVVGNVIISIQPCISTLMAMTKSDVRTYVWELVTLSYFRSPSVPAAIGTTGGSGIVDVDSEPTMNLTSARLESERSGRG